MHDTSEQQLSLHCAKLSHRSIGSALCFLGIRLPTAGGGGGTCAVVDSEEIDDGDDEVADEDVGTVAAVARAEAPRCQ